MQLTPDLPSVKHEQWNALYPSGRLTRLRHSSWEARVALLGRSWFWGRLATWLEVYFTTKVATTCIRADGVLLINPDAWEVMSLSARMFCIAHGAGQLCFLHFERRGDVPAPRWQRATEVVLGHWLLASGIEVPCFETGNPFTLQHAGGGSSTVEKVAWQLAQEERTFHRTIWGLPMGTAPVEGGLPGLGTWWGDGDWGATPILKQVQSDPPVPAIGALRDHVFGALVAATQQGERLPIDQAVRVWLMTQMPYVGSWEEWVNDMLVERRRVIRMAESLPGVYEIVADPDHVPTFGRDPAAGLVVIDRLVTSLKDHPEHLLAVARYGRWLRPDLQTMLWASLANWSGTASVAVVDALLELPGDLLQSILSSAAKLLAGKGKAPSPEEGQGGDLPAGPPALWRQSLALGGRY